jgi:hypothetical protein
MKAVLSLVCLDFVLDLASSSSLDFIPAPIATLNCGTLSLGLGLGSLSLGGYFISISTK